MIVRILLRTPAGHIVQKTFFGVTALVDSQTHVLQVLNKNKVVVAEYPSGSYLWWHKVSTPQLRLSRASMLLQQHHGTSRT
jgi:hypothetical protein